MRFELPVSCLFAMAIFGLGGCTPPPSDNIVATHTGEAMRNAAVGLSDTAPAEPDAPYVAETSPNPTAGGDGSEILLSPLSPQEISSAKLDGELACSFETAGAVMMIARGNVASADRSDGVVKVGDYIEPIGAPGGFDAMAKGTRFDGQGKMIRIAVSGQPQGGGESPPRFASLTYYRADGAERTFKGYWTCGP